MGVGEICKGVLAMNMEPFNFCLQWMVYEYLPTLKTGDFLPGQLCMPDRIGVERKTYREVLRVLDFHGVIYVKHGKPTKFISLNKPALLYVMESKGLTGQTT